MSNHLERLEELYPAVCKERDELRQQVTLLREALEQAKECKDIPTLLRICTTALAATEQSDVVLCDAEPHTRCEYTDDNGMLHSIIFPEPLYARRRT